MPFLLQQGDGIDWGDGESEEVQITVLEAGTEGKHSHEGSQGVTGSTHPAFTPLPCLQCPCGAACWVLGGRSRALTPLNGAVG